MEGIYSVVVWGSLNVLHVETCDKDGNPWLIALSLCLNAVPFKCLLNEQMSSLLAKMSYISVCILLQSAYYNSLL